MAAPFRAGIRRVFLSTAVCAIIIAAGAGWWPVRPAAAAVPESSPGGAVVPLTAAERAWMREHPVIRFGVSEGFAPFNFRDESGTVQGIAVDYLRLFAAKTGLNLQIDTIATWDNLLQLTEAGVIDGVLCGARSAVRDRLLAFTNDYFVAPWVLVTRTDEPEFQLRLDALGDRRVCVLMNSPNYDRLAADSSVRVVGARTVEEIWRIVSSGRADVGLSNVIAAEYYINHGDITNLKISGIVDEQLHLGAGVRKDWPVLVGILNRGIAAITPAEAETIRTRWVTSNYSHADNAAWRRIRHWVMVGGLLFAVFMVSSLLWNLRLRREIAERSRTEKALRASEEKFRLIAQMTPAGIYQTTPEGKCTYVNDRWQEMSGLTSEEAYGAGWINGIHPADRQGVLDNWKQMVDSRGNWGKEYRFRNKEGKITWVYGLATPERDAAGNIVGYIGLNVDITERKLAEEALRIAARDWQVTFDAVNDAVWLLDADSRIVRSNRATRTIFGREPADVIGRRCWEIVHGTAAPIPDCPVQRLKNTLQRETMTLAAQQRYYQVTVDPIINGAGALAGIVHLVSDITERKCVELALGASNAELAQFSYTVSHDLKSPLTTIRGFVDAIGQDIARQRHDRVPADLKRIEHAADRMLALVNDLLELSRLGRVTGQAERVDFAVLVREVLAMLDRAIAERRAQVIVADGLPVVTVDRQRMVSALQNLVENALKYMGGQPQPRIEIGVRRGSEPVFYVQDNGMGIDPQHHEKIFGIFDKLEPNSTGTGIGLALVRRIIAAHGGRIWVESAGAGQGSTFFFTLPDPPAAARM